VATNAVPTVIMGLMPVFSTRSFRPRPNGRRPHVPVLIQRVTDLHR
jgi:hypothetical protein